MTKKIVAVLDEEHTGTCALDRIYDKLVKDENGEDRTILKETKQGTILFGGTTIMFNNIGKVAKAQNKNIEEVTNMLIKSSTKPIRSSAFLEAALAIKPQKQTLNFI